MLNGALSAIKLKLFLSFTYRLGITFKKKADIILYPNNCIALFLSAAIPAKYRVTVSGIAAEATENRKKWTQELSAAIDGEADGEKARLQQWRSSAGSVVI